MDAHLALGCFVLAGVNLLSAPYVPFPDLQVFAGGAGFAFGIAVLLLPKRT